MCLWAVSKEEFLSPFGTTVKHLLSYLINNDRSRSFRPDSIGFKKTFGITAASRQQGVMALCDAATETAVEGRAGWWGWGGMRISPSISQGQPSSHLT